MDGIATISMIPVVVDHGMEGRIIDGGEDDIFLDTDHLQEIILDREDTQIFMLQKGTSQSIILKERFLQHKRRSYRIVDNHKSLDLFNHKLLCLFNLDILQAVNIHIVGPVG